MKKFLMQSWAAKSPTSARAKCLRLFALAAISFAAGSWVTLHWASTRSVHADGNRVFELRIYHVNPGRLASLNTLFQEHTLPLFKEHGITGIGYWHPQDAPDSDNTLIYLIAHPSREEAKKNWDAFFADPEWQPALKAASAEGKLTDKIDSTFMDPADFSPLK
jgi:hypothetical protein